MKITGVVPAMITPLNLDETINTEVLEQLINGLLNIGADGSYITGEGISLAQRERRILTKA